MRVLEGVISDRGSRYTVAGRACADMAAAKEFLRGLRADRRFARATHHSWALTGSGGALKHDDGETGAGMVILREIERAGLEGHIVVVSRWFGGKHLGGDRFRHIRAAVRLYLEALEGADAR